MAETPALQRAALDRLHDRLPHCFADESLLLQALTHKSVTREHNERLEFLGDAVLGQVVASILFHRFPEQSEAGLTLMRAQLVRKDTLAAVAEDWRVGDALLLGTAERASAAHRRASVLSDAVEAIIGAVFLDAGYESACRVVEALLEQPLAVVNPQQLKDPKTRLQEWLQGQGEALPRYELTRTEGAAHAQSFFVACHVDAAGARTDGSGSSRRRAEQDAAEAMLVKLKVSE